MTVKSKNFALSVYL